MNSVKYSYSLTLATKFYVLNSISVIIKLMETEIIWKAPEFHYYPKTTAWYYWSIFITLLMIVFAVWQNNFLFGFFIVVAETLILSWGGKKPRDIDFILNEKGLTVGTEKAYSYTELKSFAETNMDIEDSPFVELMLYFQKRLRPTMLVLLPKEKSVAIQSALAKKIPKIEADPTFLDTLERIVRF